MWDNLIDKMIYFEDGISYFFKCVCNGYVDGFNKYIIFIIMKYK